MRARLVLGCLGSFVAAAFVPFACIPHPKGDFEDYQERIASFPSNTPEASVFDSAPPPTEAQEKLYYGACLSELALGQVTNVFSFYTKTKYVPSAGGVGGTLEVSIQALQTANGDAPTTFTSSGITGGIIPDPKLAIPPAAVDGEGRFLFELRTTTVPGNANPISGGEVLIELATLRGRFQASQFCARLGGEVKAPSAAARTLTEQKNVCRFFILPDNSPIPALNPSDFVAESCSP